MVKFLKQGKVVILTKGKYAGRKAVVVKTVEDISKARPFPHAIVVGVNRNPRPVTKSMSRRQVLSRTRVQPFVKVVNYNHIMPTRYASHMPFLICLTCNLTLQRRHLSLAIDTS